MPIPSIVPVPLREYDVIARFPIPYRGLTFGGSGPGSPPAGWDVNIRRAPYVNPGDVAPFSNGSSGGTGVGAVYRPGTGVPGCFQQTSTAGVGWCNSFVFPWMDLLPLDLGGVNIGAGTPFPEATRVHWIRLWFQWLQNPDHIVSADEGGYFLTPYRGSTLGGQTVIPGGSGAQATAFGLVGRLSGSGGQGFRCEFYDPAGAVTLGVDVPDAVVPLGGQQWMYSDWVLVNGSGGRKAALTVSVQGEEIVSQELDNVTFFAPDQLTAGGSYLNAYQYGLHIGGQGAASCAVRTRIEIRSGKYLPDGREVRS